MYICPLLSDLLCPRALQEQMSFNRNRALFAKKVSFLQRSEVTAVVKRCINGLIKLHSQISMCIQ